MIRMLLALGALFRLLPGWQTAPVGASLKVLRFGKLVAGTGQVLSNAVVVIENDRICSESALVDEGRNSGRR